MTKFIDEDIYVIGSMTSGRLYAELISNVAWEGFPNYAEAFIRRFSGSITSKNDSVDTRVWSVIIGGHPLQMVYEDFEMTISLESQSEGGDQFIKELREILMD